MPIKECRDCPFRGGDDYGCLPSAYEIRKWHFETGKSWACHSEPHLPCAGHILDCVENGRTIDMSKPLITESTTLKEIYNDRSRNI